MAKITITIEDLPNGGVKVAASPNFATIMKMDLSGADLTPAHGYAIFALNRIREESKRKEPTKIWVPPVRRM